MSTTNRHKRGLGLGALVAVVVIALGLLAVYWQRYTIYDWYRLRNYSAPQYVVSLASATAMNDYGRKLFYVNYPQLNDRDAFSTNCQNDGERTIVLGCYISGQGIFIFDVQDERLAGVEEVTAAHEMLHAAYDRLSPSDKERIDELTQQVYDQTTNQRLRDNVESYRKRDSTVVPNELHSIIGTEVRELPAELDNYYKRYFTNRLAVVALAEKYEQAFIERENKAKALEAEISSLRQQIDELEAQLSSDRARLEADRENITSNQEVISFNIRVNTYNSDTRYLNNLIDQHNGLVEQYKQVVIEENELIKALDSRPSTL